MIDLRYGRDAIEVLREMPAESVHVCVTSPPYFGLRDYGCAGQIGLEPTLQEFIAKLVAVFAEVHRVLHPSGTLWVNIGDSYYSSTSVEKRGDGEKGKNDDFARRRNQNIGSFSRKGIPGMKPKDLMMVPSRFAIAMQDWGWYLRDFIVWAKPAPMPESVTDRCTKAWEPIFMFAKSPRYYADMEAVKQPISESGQERIAREVANENFKDLDYKYSDIKTFGKNSKLMATHAARDPSGANLRNVWTLPPESFSGKHFATFPSSLPMRCILIGSSAKGCCPHCLAPWVRVTERFDTGRKQKAGDGWDTGEGAHGTIHRSGRSKGETGVPVMADKTVGWAASCQCQHTEADTIHCRVLDPFSGSGTTGRVAFDLGRDYIGIDLNKEYEPLARERIGGLFIS